MRLETSWRRSRIYSARITWDMRGFVWLCWGIAGFALVGCQGSNTQPSDFQLNFRADDQQVFSQVDRVREFNFPQDHGPHEDFRNEWWYLTSILETAEGRKFGAQFTLFVKHSVDTRNPPIHGEVHRFTSLILRYLT